MKIPQIEEAIFEHVFGGDITLVDPAGMPGTRSLPDFTVSMQDIQERLLPAMRAFGWQQLVVSIDDKVVQAGFRKQVGKGLRTKGFAAWRDNSLQSVICMAALKAMDVNLDELKKLMIPAPEEGAAAPADDAEHHRTGEN